MKAMVYTGKDGLTIRDVETPVAGPGQVRLKLTNCGICGSDLFLYKSGGLADGTIMGHELSGVVDTVGDGVEGISVGDRVIARPIGCGECKWCRMKMENICVTRKTLGLGQRPGGFAEYMVVEKDMIIPVPENLGLDQASMADQFGSSLHGLYSAGFQPGDTVLVTGVGPIGLCAVMLLKYKGAKRVIVSEVIEERAVIAKKFGADDVVSPGKRPLASLLSALPGYEGLDCVIECSGNATATTDVILTAPVGCRIALVGMCTQPVTFMPFVLFQKHLTITGAFGNSQKECIESMDIMASGEIPSQQLITKKVSLEEIPGAFLQLMNSKTELKVMMETPV